jgi:hypothetical protein
VKHLSNVPRHRARRRALWRVADPTTPRIGKALAEAAHIEGPHREAALASAVREGALRIVGPRGQRLSTCALVQGVCA